jgi:hypothetical protein
MWEKLWRALCRIGVHVMRRDARRLPLFEQDLYAACQCGRERLRMETVDRRSWEVPREAARVVEIRAYWR